MKKLSSTARIVMSLVSLATSVLLVAGTLGMLPDGRAETLRSRTQLSESLATTFATMAKKTDLQTMEALFGSIVSRNEDVVSIGLRRAEGILLLSSGDHETHWDAGRGDLSSETQIVVPVHNSSERWGSIEVAFQPLGGTGVLGFLKRPEIRLALFMGVTLWIAYYLYLRNVLRQLNPSRVIPGRVREAFDSLAEGILVMDAQQNVVLANRAFEECAGLKNADLLGRPVESLPFEHREENSEHEMPWKEAVELNSTVNRRLLALEARTFSVSASPIVDDRGRNRGVLASFEDVTQLRDKNDELRQIVGHLHESTAEIQRQNQELEQLANFDPLTGCHNRRSFFDRYDAIWNSALQYQAPLSAILADIDKFKSINDNHGHSAGDDVLRRVAGVLHEQMRPNDLLCRYGGEEFVILLPQTDIDEAYRLAEEYRAAIENLRIPDIPVTASFGLSALSEKPADTQALLDQADKCLYLAKENGRNQVVRWDKADTTQLESEDVSDSVAEPHQDSDVFHTIPYHAVTALVAALAFRDQQTAAHSRRVADLAVALGEGLLSHKDCYTLEMAALLHDIGKIGVPDAILLKPDGLDEDEWTVMQSYSHIGVEIIHASFASSALTELVASYRQRYDDPDQPRASVGARILAVADAYDSMTSDRSYRKALSHEEAMDELKANGGKQFDPEIVSRLTHVANIRRHAGEPWEVGRSAEIARSIGLQIERLVTAIDDQDVGRMSTLAERLEATADRYGEGEIALKARDLRESFDESSELYEIMQTATELLDMCRATQGALLRQNVVSSS